MGQKNYLVEGVSGSGKTSVCEELLRRGLHAIHGDRVLAYQGDPQTGEPLEGRSHEHHIWDITKVRRFVFDRTHPTSFFCGGSRNFSRFVDLFDAVFVLETDWETLEKRLSLRPAGEWGSCPQERALVQRLHQSREDIPPQAIGIPASLPLEEVVDSILREVSDPPFVP